MGSSHPLKAKDLPGVDTQVTGPSSPGVFLRDTCPDLGAGARVPREM